jgi:transcriptional regulator with XRE-family HTH domain
MDGDWVRVGEAIRRARRQQKMTQEQLGDASGTSTSNIRVIEAGKVFAKVTHTLRAIEQALEWEVGSIEAILNGGEPTNAPPSPAQPGRRVNREGLPYRIAQALNEGTVLDTRLKTIGSGGEIVILVKGREGATDEEKRAILREWERQEGHLDRLGEVADDSSENP